MAAVHGVREQHKQKVFHQPREVDDWGRKGPQIGQNVYQPLLFGAEL